MIRPIVALTTLALLSTGCSSADTKNSNHLRDTGYGAIGGGGDAGGPAGAGGDSGLPSTGGEGCHPGDTPTDHDRDGDGWASLESGGSDCNDNDADIYPGAVDEWYDGVDSNCESDDDYDRDADGYVAPEHVGLSTLGLPDSGALPATDCDDTDGAIHPNAIDFWHDGIDGDCAGNDDYDADADGYVPHVFEGRETAGVFPSGHLPPGDCDDYDDAIHPNATDVPYDGHDSDCRGNDDFDRDGDGYVPTEHVGRITTEVSGSGLLPGGDCRDADPDIHPGAPDIWYDGIDSNCDGRDDFDADGDGYTLDDGDCLDTDPTVYPDAVDAWYDGIDSNCDGSDDHDADGDGWTPDEGDCLDTDPTAYPGAVDTWYDGIDSNCDGLDDFDADADGFARIEYGDLPTVGIHLSGGLPGEDCDDSDALIFPGAIDTWYDGIDSDCDGRDDYDFDRDGWTPDEGDCDDASSSTYPGAADTWYDGIDSDCDSRDDFDADGDGWRTTDGDCDDGRSGINPGVAETCDDGIDNNCNGSIDEGCVRDTPSDDGGGGCD